VDLCPWRGAGAFAGVPEWYCPWLEMKRCGESITFTARFWCCWEGIGEHGGDITGGEQERDLVLDLEFGFAFRPRFVRFFLDLELRDSGSLNAEENEGK